VLAGINTLHVPYKGSTPAITDMIGERVDFAFFGISGSMQQARAGQIRMLGMSTLKRSPNFPDIPAVAETVPGFELNSWYGYMAPAGTPREVITRLQREVAVAVKKPEVMAWMKENGLDPVGSTPEEYGAFIRSELVKWAKAIKDAKITPGS
jgi:tripartite-type tricarboxylate transporter receptor subunit TctC